MSTEVKTLEIVEKECNRCGVISPLSGFYRQRQNRDGHRPECKDCTKANVMARKRERIARDGIEKERERGRAAVKRYRDKTGNAWGRAYNQAQWRAFMALADNHRREYEQLFLIEKRERGLT